jgi:ABC-type branched-subunit amino acid transport system ATPase component
MASLLTLLDLSLHFGGPAILDKVNLQLEGGERVCLVGRNGAGKTTLMKVIMGDMKPDTGDLFRRYSPGWRRRFPPISGAACTTLSRADFGPTTTATRRTGSGTSGSRT